VGAIAPLLSGLCGAAVGVGAVLAAVRAFTVEVAGRSMMPTLEPGDWLLAVRAGRIERGDLVVVRHPDQDLELVKRVAGLPGEGDLGPDRYLVVGDNPRESTDGRAFGPVSRAAIAGVVVARYRPRPRLL
jgi:nickel-type superoxide dismutase maturation protease